MYVGNEIKLMYKDLTYVVGVLHMVGFDFYVDKIKVGSYEKELKNER